LETYFNFPSDSFENGGMLQMIRNYSAVTAACALIRRDVFEAVGGFDEEHFAVSFNDVDLCLRIRDRGYSIVYTPHAASFITNPPRAATAAATPPKPASCAKNGPPSSPATLSIIPTSSAAKAPTARSSGSRSAC